MGHDATTHKRWFAAAVIVAAAWSIAVAVILLLPVFNTLSTAVDDVSEGLAAYVAAAACLWASRSASTVRTGRAWVLMALSALCWGIGQTIWTVVEVGFGIVPFPSLADAGFLSAVPLAFAAVVLFWRPGRGFFSVRRLVLDALIVLLALLFTAWAAGLRDVWNDFDDPLFERFVDVAYPVGDILIGTVLILGIRRATHSQQGRMLLLLAGLAGNALADSAFAYLTTAGNYTIHGSVLDTGWVLGYLVIALAALWPAQQVDDKGEPSPYDVWQLGLPWIAVVGAAASAFLLAVTGHTLDLFLTGLAGVGAALLAASMVLAQFDSLSALRRSQRSEAALAEVIENAPVGILRADTKSRVVGANHALGTLLGVRPESMLGLTFDRYIPVDAQTEVFERLAAVASGAVETATGELPLLRTDGSTVWVRWTATAVKRSSGETDYVLTTLENMDAQHQAETAAKESLETLERLNTVKTEFLQNVSHEFKTALIGIQGFSEFMRDADQLDVNDARAFAADIHRDAERLDRMVTEMVALDTVENSRAALHVERVDLDAVIRQEVDGSSQRVHGSTVALRIQPDLPAIAGDRQKLSQVVHALMENAIKRSPEGGHIMVSAAANGSGVEVSFKDEGVRAQSEYDNRLFGKEDLYANSPIRKVVGTGLALGIARQVVEMHGGRFWVNGGGVEFHFSIPVLWKDREEAVALTASSTRVA
jgi:PAS domain S-box-containing protein